MFSNQEQGTIAAQEGDCGVVVLAEVGQKGQLTTCLSRPGGCFRSKVMILTDKARQTQAFL